VLVENAPWLVDWGYDVSDLPFKRRGPIDPWTRANAIPVISEIKRFKRRPRTTWDPMLPWVTG
jgi:processive 1,2-diacylglycerol beta-glucosyltransferase